MSSIMKIAENNQSRFNDILMAASLLIFTILFALFFLPIPLNYHPFAWHSSGIDNKLWETQAQTLQKYQIIRINNTDHASFDGVTYVVNGEERFASMEFQGMSALVNVKEEGLSYYSTKDVPDSIEEPYSYHYEHAIGMINRAVDAIYESEQRLAVLQEDKLKFEGRAAYRASN